MILKDCPFCGGKAELKADSHHNFFGCFTDAYYVECLSCGVQTGLNYDSSDRNKTNAIKRWNKRI